MTQPALASKTAPPSAFRWLEASSIIACIGVDLALGYHVALGLHAHWPGPWSLLGLCLAAYLAADLTAGLVHFFGDSFGSVDTPVLGTTFVLPFRGHHDHPEEMSTHDFIETNGNNAFATLFVVVPCLLFVPMREGGVATSVGVFTIVFSVLLLLTNQIHKWAHVPRPPRIVQWLQRSGVLLSPERHRAHHAPPYGRGFCVTSGIFNVLLDPLGFFPWLARVIRAVLRLSRPAR